jgi:hypothetical protein
MRHVTMLVFCGLLIGIAGCGNAGKSEVNIVEALEVSGATVSRGLDGNPMTIRYASGGPTVAELSTFQDVTSLQEIHAEVPDAGDKEFAMLAKMPSLSVLSLTGTKATGQAIKSLAASKSLESLDISGASGLTDDDLKPLSGHARLRVLNLSEIPLTDAIADVIVSLPKLEELSLVGTKITGATIQRLADENPNIKSLSIGSDQITDDVIPLIAMFSNLEFLQIKQSAITGESLAALSHLPKLKMVRLTNCANVTNDGILQLANVPALYHLDVSGTQFTAVGLNQKGFASLNMLEANGTGVTDDAISQFKGLPVLYSVTLLGTAVTTPGVRKHFAANHQTAFRVDE